MLYQHEKLLQIESNLIAYIKCFLKIRTSFSHGSECVSGVSFTRVTIALASTLRLLMMPLNSHIYSCLVFSSFHLSIWSIFRLSLSKVFFFFRNDLFRKANKGQIFLRPSCHGIESRYRLLLHRLRTDSALLFFLDLLLGR